MEIVVDVFAAESPDSPLGEAVRLHLDKLNVHLVPVHASNRRRVEAKDV